MRSKSLSVSRRHFSPAERVGLLKKYHGSRLIQREFVEQHGLSLATLTKWLRWEREAVPAPRGKSVSFAEVPVVQVPGSSPWAVEVVRPDGWTVRLARDTPAGLVAQLLGAC
jgi:hypothetical protein